MAAAVPAEHGTSQPVLAGAWGRGRPSFWCCSVETEQAKVVEFLVREDDAARFRQEHPSCVGADLKARYSPVPKATAEAKLAVFEPLMDMAALDARDQSAPGYQPRINTDVRRRHHLAG